MRPVVRGIAPNDYNDYRDAKTDLIGRIDDYCSYCERHIETHFAVEHIIPQHQDRGLERVWTNFVLSCGNCNSCKNINGTIVIDDYYWPDRDNTFYAMEYTRGGLVQPRQGLTPLQQAKSLATIRLTGLDKYPNNPNGREPTDADNRWHRRCETWLKAERERDRLAAADSIPHRESIVELAHERGMFSIWWTVFEGDEDMRRRLREAFIGTDPNCFDANENLVPRPGRPI